MTAIKGLKGESENSDVDVTPGINVPSLYGLEVGVYALGFSSRMEGSSILPFPAFFAMVSGFGKREIAFSSLPQIFLSLSLVEVPRKVLLTRDWPVFKA